ncbi:Conserved_hypothetical protein [Hexamita inflata]|uniref:Uncharacterized protein n=1 Tax=Hexamita inflata TaxID=28002 RepID=A0AA86P789_9EUKA|nr:Conserved hypothetical protein [Hexamita inflata]
MTDILSSDEHVSYVAEDAPKHAPLAGLKIPKKTMPILHTNNAAIKSVNDGPRYVYLARYSPMCKCFKITSITYLVYLIVASVLLIFNTSFCGMDAPSHTLRLRNVTYPITYEGLTASSTTNSTYPVYNGQQDTVFFFDPSKSTSLQLLSNETVFRMDRFPLALVLNYTQSGKNEISQLVFGDKTNPSIEDNGAAFDIVVSNPKRKRFTTAESFFNFNYWAKREQRYNYTGNGKTGICSSAFQSQNNEFWRVANTREPETTVSLWFVSLDSLTASKEACSDDYRVHVLTSEYFCFSPMLIREVPFHTVLFNGSHQTSEIIVDFNKKAADSKIGFKFIDSKVSRIWLTKANSDDTIDVSVQNSEVVFYIPKNEEVKFYGVTGNRTTSSNSQELYKLEYQIKNENIINKNLQIKLQQVVGFTPEAVGNVVTFGNSKVTFDFEGNSRKITFDPATWTATVENI